MVSALRVDTPCPVLHLLGEQGSGKTVLAKTLIALVDPGRAARAAAGNEERLQNAAFGSRVYGIDNLTHIQPWLSDGLCAIVTGERERRRKLYTDATPFYLEIKSAVIITGISLSGAGPDLLERMLPIQLDKIEEGERRERRRCSASSRRRAPSTSAACSTLPRRCSRTSPATRRRRTCHGWPTSPASSRARPGPGTRPARSRTTSRSPRSSAPTRPSIQPTSAPTFQMDGRLVAERRRRVGRYGIRPTPVGGAAALRRLVRQRQDPASVGYPHNPRGASAALRRLAPALRVLGIEWTPPPSSGRSHERKMMLKRVAETPELRNAP